MRFVPCTEHRANGMRFVITKSSIATNFAAILPLLDKVSNSKYEDGKE